MKKFSKADVDDVYVLSPLQKGLLVESRAQSNTGVYLIQHDITFANDIQESHLRRVWGRLIDQYPILRTEFYWEGLNEPVQVVRSDVEVPVERHDWSGVADETEARFDDLANQRRREGLDLHSAPLFQLDLIHLPSGESRILWTVHHLIVDGWSTGLLADQMVSGLDAIRKGEELDIPPTSPYREYIEWIETRDQQKAAEFWRQKLGTVEPVSLPGSDDREAEDSKKYGTTTRELGTELTKRLEQLAKDAQVPISVVFQGAWIVLLSRYCNAQTVTYGLVTSGRNAPLEEMERRVGMFVNTLPMQVSVQVDTSLVDWLGKLQQEQAEILEYGFSALTDINRWIGNWEGKDLFEGIFGFQNFPVEGVDEESLETLSVEEMDVQERPHTPLAFPVTKHGDVTKLTVHYQTGRFRGETIEQWLDHYIELLESFCERPQQAPAAQRMLSTSEYGRLLEEWGTGPQIDAPSQPVHRVFEQRVDKHPESTALRFEDDEWTYRQLNRRANRVAERLDQVGVGPGVPVGVSIKRSSKLVATMLGVWKTGGTYVPLEPSLPEPRLSYILSDLDIETIVAGTQGVGREEFRQSQYLDIDKILAGSRSSDNLTTEVELTDVAYVMYTSGTTGHPKGVVVPHRALANHVACHPPHPPYDTDRDCCQLFKASAGFDMSLAEIFPALANGATVAVAPAGTETQPGQLLELIQSHEVTDLLTTPTNLQLLLDCGSHSAWKNLERVYTAGEAQTEPLRTQFYERANARLHNFYGPTEMCGGQTGNEVSKELEGPSPIGRPLGNHQVVVRGWSLDVTPPQIDGELCIAGAGEAYGYWDRCRHTAEAFVPNPWGEKRGARIYRTGDLGHWRPDGRLAYAGRIDEQVQVGGVRIEPGEVETQLERLSGVRHGVVRGAEVQDGRADSLVAYVVPEDESELSVELLRQKLAEQIPKDRIPSRFIAIEEIPRTARGKIDEEVLPTLGQELEGEERVEPRTDIEATIASIWQEHLELDEVGIFNSFFELGGNSLLGMKVRRDLEEAFDVEVPIRIIMTEGETIAALADYIVEQKAQELSPEEIAELRSSMEDES